MINEPATNKPSDTDKAQRAEGLLAEARKQAEAGRAREAFQTGAQALLLRPGDPGILSFLSGLNTPKPPAPAPPKPSRIVTTAFDALPFVQRVRELRGITGGSLGCGWMNEELALMVYTLVKWLKPELVVQTGHLWGKSAVMVLESLNDGFLTPASPLEAEEQNADKIFTAFQTSNRPAGGQSKFISVDPGPIQVPRPEAGIKYLQGLHPNFEFYPMMSTDFFAAHGARLKAEHAGQRILGIVDGDHTYWGCLLDLDCFAQLGAKMIIVDDTVWLPYIGRAAKMFARRHGYQFLDLTWYNGVAILFKEEDYMKTKQPRPSGFSFRVALAHFLYSVGGLKLMKLIQRPKE